jgi:DNA-directed RNA polymerase subunit RPC12/RpoP
MPSARSIIRWFCPYCSWQEDGTVAELDSQLRRLGMIKREEQAEVALLLELARIKKPDIRCPSCRKPGFTAEAVDPTDDGWGAGKPCANCGKEIPAERLELFPDQDLCAACQGKIDSGGQLSGDDYCPHCGTPMIVKQTRQGVSRYQQVCPNCRK